jgi:Gpi18-like mannosyltransferase
MSAKLFKRLFVVGILVRVILLGAGFHSDLNNHAIWGIYAREFGLKGFYDWLNFGNYARPDYPPLAIVLFLTLRRLYEVAFWILWKVNVAVGIFPSVIISWMDKWGYLAFLKLPALAGDIGIAALIYESLKVRLKAGKARVMAIAYFLNPGVIYLTAMWGQIDSFVVFLGILSVFLLLRKRYLAGFGVFFLGVLTKQTMLPAFVVLVIYALKRGLKLKQAVFVVMEGAGLLFFVGWIFSDHNYLEWSINTYIDKFLVGAKAFPCACINLNAFNFWGLVLGLERMNDSVEFLGVSLLVWATLIGGIGVAGILWSFARKQKEDVYATLTVLFFVIFMFFPRMHERYLFPVVALFPLAEWGGKDAKVLYFLLSLVFAVNLYHWWWVPEIPAIVPALDFELVERGLSLLNLGLFAAILRKYERQ